MTAAPTTPTGSPLAKPVITLWGVGAERARQLHKLGIASVEDLLLHRPRRYEDRRRFRPIGELQTGELMLTRGSVVALGVKHFRKGTKSVFELILDDGTARLHCRWWNLPFMEKYFQTGDEVVVFGKLLSLKPRTMDHPETEVVEAGEERFIHFNRITPIYPLTEGLPQRWLRGLIWRTLEQFGTKIPEPKIPEPKFGVPKGGTSNLLFLPRVEAIRRLHFPETMEDVERARRRLALDEFIELQGNIRQRRRNFEVSAGALPCGGDNRLIKPFLAKLRFKLTDAQTRVLREIRSDLRGRHPMRRLLQGDVGSGKTVVAACSALMAIESGYHVALMAPTEILAEQHYRNFEKWFAPLGLKVGLQTGSRKVAKGSEAAQTAQLTIGTHALLTADFDLPRLGLVIIDEQHKFGVTQREQLVRKGRYPHLLVMTATPIPRTLGLTLYGDLDISTIDAAPPGRGRIKTFVRTADTLSKVWSFVRDKLAAGRQAYVVYPRVEDTGPNVKAVVTEFENLKRTLSPFTVGLLHGRLAAREKEAVMEAFRVNTVRVLLATSLIEVGVDVPNATILVIENAEMFGLAQLHQLRGRIGRGANEAYCILISNANVEETRQRFKVLEETTDGFRIAEADLKLRGPGELLGRQQSGVPDFRFGNLAADWELVKLAQQLTADNRNPN
jgi:ATP-dependent DNA helicase RecG